MEDRESGYSVEFNDSQVEKQYDNLLAFGPPRLMQDFENTRRQLQRNPYPNPQLPAGTVKKLNSHWRFRVNYRYRLIYTIAGRRVKIVWVGHRKDAYRHI